MDLNEIESRLLAACLELRPQHPEAFEGYYDRLLNEGRILTDADRAIVDYVCRNFTHDTHTLEICGGIGQLSLVLGMAGFAVKVIESDPYRHAVGVALATNIFSVFILGDWERLYPSADLIICTNAVSQSIMPENAGLLLDAIDEGCELIWQPELFGVMGVPLLEAESDEIAPGVWHQWK